MIRIHRGIEPTALAKVRLEQLPLLRGLGRPPTSDEVSGYRIVADDLWKAQHFKCCYCELKIPKGFNDVEHYRPKAQADRSPGCNKTHGYWWLAFSWDNLMFACPACNRSGKNDSFPLRMGSTSLTAEEGPPAGESPLLLDPGGAENPISHIEFIPDGPPANRWWARARRGSLLGDTTIRVCRLNRADLLELRGDYVSRNVVPHVEAVRAAIARGRDEEVVRELQRAFGLLTVGNQFVGLAFDALRSLLPTPSTLEKVAKLRWPEPDDL